MSKEIIIGLNREKEILTEALTRNNDYNTAGRITGRLSEIDEEITKLQAYQKEVNTLLDTISTLQQEKKDDLLAIQKRMEGVVGEIITEIKKDVKRDGLCYASHFDQCEYGCIYVVEEIIKKIAKSHGVKIK